MTSQTKTKWTQRCRECSKKRHLFIDTLICSECAGRPQVSRDESPAVLDPSLWRVGKHGIRVYVGEIAS